MRANTYRISLRHVLWADALSCLACGMLQVTLPGTLTLYFGLSQALLIGSGVFLLLCGAVVASLATRARVANVIVGLLILGNIAWGVLAVGILLEGGTQITLLGRSYIVMQALTVLVLARLQYSCLRVNRAERLPAARQET
jgi:hypothetical protein